MPWPYISPIHCYFRDVLATLGVNGVQKVATCWSFVFQLHFQLIMTANFYLVFRWDAIWRELGESTWTTQLQRIVRSSERLLVRNLHRNLSDGLGGGLYQIKTRTPSSAAYPPSYDYFFTQSYWQGNPEGSIFGLPKTSCLLHRQLHCLDRLMSLFLYVLSLHLSKTNSWK